MDFTLALADVAVEFFQKFARENGRDPEVYVNKLREYISQIDPTIKVMERLGINNVKDLKKKMVEVTEMRPELVEKIGGQGKVPVQRGRIAGYVRRNFLPYPGWAVETVFRDILTEMKKEKMTFNGMPLTREALVRFAADEIRLMPRVGNLMQKIAQSREVGLRNCFIVTASLKPFAEGISFKLGQMAGVKGPAIPLKNIHGVEVKTDSKGIIKGFENYHKNEKIDNIKKVEGFVLEDMRRRKLQPKHGNPLSHIIYIGDGITDKTAMRHVNLGEYTGKKSNDLKGRGMTIAVNPQKKLLETGVVETAYLARDLSYMWDRLILPFVRNRGSVRRVRKQPKKGTTLHSTLLKRWELEFGKMGALPGERTKTKAQWYRDYLVAKARDRRRLWLQRALKSAKRRLKGRRGKKGH